MRQCGDCQLCCKLLPIKEVGKPAGVRCQHQRHHKGCAIYPGRPVSCALWNCRWLVDADMADQQRPDRSHLVVDIMPDFVVVEDKGQRINQPVVQVWMDPDYPDAHKDPRFRAYVERRGREGIITLIRTSAGDAFALVPPCLMGDGQWKEVRTNLQRVEAHTAEEIAEALSPC